MALPEGVIGLNAVQDTRDQSNQVHWEVTSNFKEINLWQHDVVPDCSVVNECLEWFEVASAVSFMIALFVVVMNCVMFDPHRNTTHRLNFDILFVVTQMHEI